MPTDACSKYTLKQTVVLVGMMGSGKSAVGRTLANRLEVPFVDSDTAIEAAAAATIAEIFARDGEAFFRKRESEVLARLLAGEPKVVSTGGGAFLSAENRALIARNGVGVWLDASLDILWERVRNKDSRPLLRTADPKATLAAIYHDRFDIYAQAAVRLPISASASIDETTRSLIALLAENNDILELTQC